MRKENLDNKQQNSYQKKPFDSYSIVRVIVFVFFFIYAVSLVLPLFWGFMMSLKTRVEYVQDWASFLPKKWQFVNYITAFTKLEAAGTNMIMMLINSLWYSLGLVFVNIFLAATSSYVIAKYEFVGRRIFQVIAYLTQIIPIVGGFAAQYRVMMQVGFYDNPLVIIGLASSFGYVFIMLETFFRNLSWEYAEAAFIDGAGHTKTFVTIMLPMCITPILTFALTSFIGVWGEYYNLLLYLPSYPTLMVGLYMYQTIETRYLNYPVLFAGLFLSMAPIMVIFFIYQKKILDLQFGGGLKG